MLRTEVSDNLIWYKDRYLPIASAEQLCSCCAGNFFLIYTEISYIALRWRCLVDHLNLHKTVR